MATSSISHSPSGIENYQLFSYASKSEDNRKITAIIENYLAPTPEMEREGRSVIQFMPDVIRLHQLTGGTYSLVTRYPNPTFTYLKLLREFALRLFCEDFMEQPTPEALQDKSDIEWPCRDEVLKTCDIAYGRLLITLMTERFAVHPKINTNKYSSMHIAIMSGDVDLITHMIEQRCPLNLKDDDGYSPLHRAVNHMNSNSESVQLLADAKANIETVNKQGMTPLTLAANIANLQAVRILLAAGANVEHTDNDGRTPIHHAAAMAYRKIKDESTIIEAFIKAGAIINQQDQNGNTSLLIALRYGGLESARCLIPGSDVNMRNSDGETALMRASITYPCLIDPLIKKGARVNLQMPSRRTTALFWATSRGQEKSVESLLVAKADPAIVDSNGKRAIDYAGRNTRIIAMLTAPRSV